MSQRCLLVLCSPFLLAASSPATLPDINEAGRVAATLNDWRAISFFLIFINVVAVVERLIAGWQSRSTATKLAEAVDRLADATESRASDIKVTLALIHASLTEVRAALRMEPKM